MNLRKIVSFAAAVSVAVSVFSFMPEGTVLAAGGDVAINPTNFPDAVFRTYVQGFDGNHDNILSLAERNTVTSIDVENMGITDLTGVRCFSNLEYLDCSRNNLGTLVLTDLTKLVFLDCYHCELTSLNAGGCPALETLYCNHNHLRQGRNYFYIGNSVKLKSVDISYNDFTALDWGNKRTVMEYLNCSHNPGLTSVNISGLMSLKVFYCSATALTSLDLSGNPGLEILCCEDMTDLDCLDVSGMTNLMSVDCWNAGLSSINVTNCPSLEDLAVEGNHLSTLDLTGDINLLALDISDNDFSGVLSLENTPRLLWLFCYGNNFTAIDLRGASTLVTTVKTVEPEEYNENEDSEEPATVLSYGRRLSADECVAGSFVDQYTFSLVAIDPDVPVITTDEEYNALFPSQDPSGNGSSNNGGTSGNNGSSGNSGSGSSGNNGSSNSSTPSVSSEAGVGGFVDRLYSVALGRNPDPAGRADWVAAITERGNTGADAARGFLYSDEFLNKQVSNEDFVRVLYRTFFDREPDTNGFNGWVAALNNGASKQEVIEGFINSTEWANLCLRYGIASGGTGVPNIEVQPNQQTIDFCTRLYTTCLNRSADQNGLMAWARQLANQRDTGSGAARGFFFSTEFTGQNVSNGEYVTRLYRTFMGREPDTDGFNAWVAQLDEGVSREVVFEGFAQSPEFTRICASYGIIR